MAAWISPSSRDVLLKRQITICLLKSRNANSKQTHLARSYDGLLRLPRPSYSGLLRLLLQQHVMLVNKHNQVSHVLQQQCNKQDACFVREVTTLYLDKLLLRGISISATVSVIATPTSVVIPISTTATSLHASTTPTPISADGISLCTRTAGWHQASPRPKATFLFCMTSLDVCNFKQCQC